MNKILKLPEVIRVTGLQRSSIYDYVKKGVFPPPINLGARSVGWVEEQVFEWISSRIEASRKQRENSPQIGGSHAR